MASELHKLETEVEIKASPEEFHHMFTSKPHHMPNATPDKVQNCELQEGEWGEVGSVFFWNYVHDGEIKTAKSVMEAIDPEKNLVTFSILEGDLTKEFKSFKSTLQCRPADDGTGSIVHWIFEYERLHDEIDHPESLLEFAADLSKDLDAHLSAD